MTVLKRKFPNVWRIFGAMLREVETSKRLSMEDSLENASGRPRTSPDAPARSHGRQDKPGLTAHAFRMTLVAQGKLPQIIPKRK